jgi:hypothetical protein
VASGTADSPAGLAALAALAALAVFGGPAVAAFSG